MTSNTSPYGIASASSEFSSSFSAWMAMNGNDSDAWDSMSSPGSSSWIQYKLISPHVVTSYSVKSANNIIGKTITNTLQASNNGSSFIDLDSQNGTASLTTFNILNLTSYLYYRLLITTPSSIGANSFFISTFNLFGY